MLVNAHLEKIKEEFFQQGAPVSEFIRSFVQGDLSLPEADCCVKGLPKAWLRSSSFSQQSTRPALYLLHPTQPHQTTDLKTPPSVAALETIRKFQNNDILTFFGVSGCGKTRAVVEMLANTWGFYMNGSQEDRGSKDITTLFESSRKLPLWYMSSDKVQNGLNIQAATCCLLISRLLVLQYCLSLGCQDTFTCERWMLLQVCPGAFGTSMPDVFDTVFGATLRAYHALVPALSLLSLEGILQDLFHLVKVKLSEYTSDSIANKFLVVLDEAQTLSDHMKDCFVSHADSRDMRSILSPIIHGLRSISDNSQNYCIVTCGTGIGADELEILLSSGGIGSSWEQVNRRIIDFPGWETVGQVAIYVENLGDMMREDDKAKLH
ncbi:hypothetical protein BGZ76_002874, partial [Entomortierella beljakovae]